MSRNELVKLTCPVCGATKWGDGNCLYPEEGVPDWITVSYDAERVFLCSMDCLIRWGSEKLKQAARERARVHARHQST